MRSFELDAVEQYGLPDFRGVGSVGTLIFGLLPYVWATAGIILLVYLSTAGLQLMLSRGDPKAVQSAQGKIANALIGMLIVAGSFLIVRLVGEIFGIEAIKNIFQWI